ncbi:MAG: hypothetical protein R6U46_02315 [Marinilabilia sp.]
MTERPIPYRCGHGMVSSGLRVFAVWQGFEVTDFCYIINENTRSLYFTIKGHEDKVSLRPGVHFLYYIR